MPLSIWSELNHENLLSTVEETLKEKLSNLILQRNSYINRVYELEKFDSRERFIVKFYRPKRWSREMVLEEHKLLQQLECQEIPVIPPLTLKGETLFEGPGGIWFAIFPKKGGRALDEFNPESWEELGRLLARIHLTGAEHKSSARVTWRPAIATKHHLEVLYSTGYLLPDFSAAFKQSAEEFIKKADPFFDKQEYLLIHGDVHKGNLIHRPGEGIYIVDFDDLCFGPAVQDIWMLLPDLAHKCENELSSFLKGYEVFRPFDKGALKLISWLRGMRIIHFASWLAVQSQEPEFATHFPTAGSAKYWNELIRDLNDIIFN